MTPRFISTPRGRIAFEKIEGDGPTVVWFGGFRSDMSGGKASRLAEWARTAGRAFLRFDYGGHGASEGEFRDGCITDWTRDAGAALDAQADGPCVFVGSSMGAWIAALCARDRNDDLRGFVGVAPAPDFTEALMWPSLPEEVRQLIETEGMAPLPSAYDEEPTIVTRKLFEDGRRNLVLPHGLPFKGPVRILQGLADPDVPWTHAVRFAEAFASEDVTVTLVKGGDHRLSRDVDLERLVRLVARIASSA